jgi:hypothetical protein
VRCNYCSGIRRGLPCGSISGEHSSYLPRNLSQYLLNHIETGRYYGMDMNVEKTKVMRISRQPSPVTITIDQKQLGNVKCFKYLGSMFA